jgi:small subunit ribosomal protein S18
MPKPAPARERREKKEQFQQFARPKIKVTRTSASGKVYVDYKDTESLRKVMSANGKLFGRKRTSADAMEQRMLARAVKRARYMALLPYVSTIS